MNILDAEPMKIGLLYYFIFLLKAPFDLFSFAIDRFIRFSYLKRFSGYMKTSFERLFLDKVFKRNKNLT
jgi:hypothetical protein